MKKIAVAFLLGIPISLGLLFTLGNRAYQRMNEAAIERSQLFGEIRHLYFAFCDDHNQPPTKLADLVPYQMRFPKGFEEIKSERWVILWGTPNTCDLKRNKSRVIGHENKSPDPSRFVLMGDGLITLEWHENFLWREEATAVCDEIGDLYFAHVRDTGKPPMELPNLEQYAARFPKGYEAIRTASWVVKWNTPPSDNANENFDIVIAVQKPTGGRTGYFILAADRSLRFKF